MSFNRGQEELMDASGASLKEGSAWFISRISGYEFYASEVQVLWRDGDRIAYTDANGSRRYTKLPGKFIMFL